VTRRDTARCGGGAPLVPGSIGPPCAAAAGAISRKSTRMGEGGALAAPLARRWSHARAGYPLAYMAMLASSSANSFSSAVIAGAFVGAAGYETGAAGISTAPPLMSPRSTAPS